MKLIGKEENYRQSKRVKWRVRKLKGNEENEEEI